jgi:hypothetical protein
MLSALNLVYAPIFLLFDCACIIGFVETGLPGSWRAGDFLVSISLRWLAAYRRRSASAVCVAPWISRARCTSSTAAKAPGVSGETPRLRRRFPEGREWVAGLNDWAELWELGEHMQVDGTITWWDKGMAKKKQKSHSVLSHNTSNILMSESWELWGCPCRQTKASLTDAEEHISHRDSSSKLQTRSPVPLIPHASARLQDESSANPLSPNPARTYDMSDPPLVVPCGSCTAGCVGDGVYHPSGSAGAHVWVTRPRYASHSNSRTTTKLERATVGADGLGRVRWPVRREKTRRCRAIISCC